MAFFHVLERVRALILVCVVCVTSNRRPSVVSRAWHVEEEVALEERAGGVFDVQERRVGARDLRTVRLSPEFPSLDTEWVRDGSRGGGTRSRRLLSIDKSEPTRVVGGGAAARLETRLSIVLQRVFEARPLKVECEIKRGTRIDDSWTPHATWPA